jgi:hypothetical protein
LLQGVALADARLTRIDEAAVDRNVGPMIVRADRARCQEHAGGGGADGRPADANAYYQADATPAMHVAIPRPK